MKMKQMFEWEKNGTKTLVRKKALRKFQKKLMMSRKYGKLLEGNLPTTVHWMNYWSEDIIRTIGMEKIQEMVDENSGFSFHKGILTIKDTAFDVDNEEDLKFQAGLQKYLFSADNN